MTEQRPAHGFTSVDRQADPEACVRCVDLLHQEPFYAAYKVRVSELLALEPGQRYLDIGGGAGDDALRRARSTGARAVLLDLSRTMATAARRRGLRRTVVGDATALPFASDSFDACSADRTFQHLVNPAAALRELVRVTRPGGRLIVVDPDYDTQVVACADQELARKVRRFRRDYLLRNGSLAHQIAGLFVTAGLQSVAVETRTLVIRDPTAADNVMGLRTWAASAHTYGLLSAAEAARWPAVIDAAVAEGRFLYAVTFFLTSGVKPA